MANNVGHLFVLTIGLIFVHQTCATTAVTLDNNGYTGVVVAIHPEEPENEALVDKLKEMITSASSYLYEATNHRAYFEEVMILIPETWRDKPEYQSPGRATYDGADVIVAEIHRKDHNLPPIPYTKRFEGCGKMGVYIHLTSEWLSHPLIEGLFGERGRVLVHEWAHYRWGLFDEYVDPKDYEDAVPPHFYLSESSNRYEPIRCTRGYASREVIQDPNTGRPRPCEGSATAGYEIGCGSLPYPTQPRSGVTASIMSGTYNIPEIVHFCDDHDHNSEAPNEHNRRCDGKSNWAVMREHVDFQNNNNPPREVDDVSPTFILARVDAARIVLVLDSSGSMSSNDRIRKMSSLSRNFLLNIAAEGHYVGIVDFDSEGRRVSGLTHIDSQDTRRRLALLIPDTAGGGTCIGSGLDTALQILSENNQSPTGGQILLITDGEDGCVQETRTLHQTLFNEGVVVHTVAYSNAADAELTELARVTGGKSYFQTDEAGSFGWYDALLELGRTGLRRDHVQVLRETQNLGDGESITKLIPINPVTGETIVFEAFCMPAPGQPCVLEVEVVSPSGRRFDSDYAGYTIDPEFHTIYIEIPYAEFEGISKRSIRNVRKAPGNWEFRVTNLLDTSQEVLTTVHTEQSEQGDDPIVATAYLSNTTVDIAHGENLKVFVEVRQGYHAVIRANVSAEIERPPDRHGIAYPPITIELLDNGAGADLRKDDGVYSRYVTGFTGAGYYGLQIYVENDGDAVILDDDSQLSFTYIPSLDPDEVLRGNIPTINGTPVLLPGVPVPPKHGSPAPNFRRGISGGSSQVPETPANWEPEDDTQAPGQITDLSVVHAYFFNRTVVLQFTAPGDDLDSGSASHYILRMSTSLTELRNSYKTIPTINEAALVYGSTKSPRQFGSREYLVFTVTMPPDENVVSYVFAVHAVDESGNEGMMSNIGHATLRRHMLPNSYPTTTSQPITEEPLGNICCYYGGMLCVYC